MSEGIVYILTNPCLDGWVKIGRTGRGEIERRLRELNAPPNIPLSFRCYAVYEVENPEMVEENIHNIIDQIDDSLHARELLENGRVREREFFRISPETAYPIFKNIATLRGDQEKLKLYVPTEGQAQEQELAERGSRRSNNSFASLQISVGEEISFLYDETLVAQVLDGKNKVGFEGERYSVTGLAAKFLTERYGWSDRIHVNGRRYFTKDGVPLSDLRDSLENAEPDRE